jgi:hypothetical protein
MRLTRRGRRASTTAALLALAVATSLTAVQADASAVTGAAVAGETVRQYEVTGPGDVADRTDQAATGASIDAARKVGPGGVVPAGPG